MARQPKQVHIFLFRSGEKGFEYALFQRSDSPFCWQGICGGLEGDETLEEGARREIFEEAGIRDCLPLLRLESISYLPDHVFSDSERAVWGEQMVVIPMYFFAMPFSGEVQLSDEHTAIKWLPYDSAYSLICYQDQQIALYELHEKLSRGLLSQDQEYGAVERETARKSRI